MSNSKASHKNDDDTKLFQTKKRIYFLQINFRPVFINLVLHFLKLFCSHFNFGVVFFEIQKLSILICFSLQKMLCFKSKSAQNRFFFVNKFPQ
jgi:hypothetical protein